MSDPELARLMAVSGGREALDRIAEIARRITWPPSRASSTDRLPTTDPERPANGWWRNDRTHLTTALQLGLFAGGAA